MLAVLAVLAGALAASGCTMIPRYERPLAPVPSTFPGSPDTSADVHAGDLAWQEFIGDDRLSKIVALALENNRDLRVAVLNVEQARAQYRITSSASLPGVDASGSFARSGQSGASASQWSANVSTSYEVDLFGRVRSQNAQALEQFFATEEAQRSARISLVSEVAAQYFALRSAVEQLELARRTLSELRDSYAITKAIVDAGGATELDLRAAEGQVQNAKISILNDERSIVQAQNALDLLAGRRLPDDLPAPRALSDTTILSTLGVGLPSDIVQRRPDILEAEHTLRAANANIGAARAAFFPTIQLTGSDGSASSQLSKLFGAGTGVWSFAPQISVPIFSGGKNNASLASARIGARISVANYEKAIQTAFREVADALVAADSYAHLVTEDATLISAEQRRYELATIRYRAGEDSYLNVISAQQDLFNAQQSQIVAQYNRLTSQLSLYKALGGGWK
jgi:multidrug efflux system outer membrane protein